MKRKLLIIGIAILLLLITAIVIIANYEPKPIPLAQEQAKSIYTNALAVIQNAKNKVLNVSTREEINLNGSVFTESTERTETYNDINSANLLIRVDEQMTVGTHSVNNCEIYSDGAVYLTIADSNFVADCAPEALSDRLTPSALFDTGLYNEISGVDNGENYSITFSAPTAIESWLTDSDVTLVCADGTAGISYDGQLVSCTYTATYLLGNITVSITVTVATQFVRNEIIMPDDLSAYIPISYIDGPRALERVSGFLTQADCVSSVYTDRIYFGALGDKREQVTTLHAYKDMQLSASVQTDLLLSNDSYENQQATHKKYETYFNDIYTVTTDGNISTSNSDITEADFQLYLQNLLLSTVMLPKYIASADAEESDSILHIQFVGTEEFALFLRESAGSILYQDSKILGSTDSSVETVELICHLALNKQTGLPLSSGIHYTGSYTAEGLPYQIQYHAEQTYSLANSQTITNINKAAGN